MSRCTMFWLAALLAAMPCLADFQLVADGVPKAQIVLSAGADRTLAVAAEELNLYLQKMSGTRLPINTTAVPERPVIQLGAPSAAWAAKAKLSSLTFDGFVVESAGDHIILAGHVPEGTLNAVYWLLEELGVRWFIPTALGESVPSLHTVTVPTMRKRVEPRFPCRRNHGINRSIRGEGAIWRRRIRITSHDRHIPFNRYSHNLAKIVRIKDHGKTHPEYFPLINGKRTIPKMHYNWQPCTSNPDVVRLAIEAAHTWWEGTPSPNYFSVGMNDGRGWCQCEKCTALDIPGHTFRGRPVKSERYFTFVKAVAAALKKTHPSKYVSCIAYSAVEPVPRNVALPDNVFAVITQDVGAWHDPAYRAEDEELARAWAKAAGAFGVYNYTSEMWLLPRVYPHLMAESLRFYDSLDAVAITNESWPTWWYAGPMMYLRAKLMWDPQQDPDKVLDDYYAGFFGPARTPMRDLYDRFETCMVKERKGKWFYGISSVPDQIALWTPGDLTYCQTQMAEAKKLAIGKPYADRVDFVARGFALTEAVLREYWQGERVLTISRNPTVDTKDVMAALNTFSECTSRRKKILDEVMKDELLSGIYDRLINERAGRLASWRGDLNAALATGLERVLSSTNALSAEQLEAIAATGGAELRRHIRSVIWARSHPNVPNLCPNPGFEETKGNAPTGINWVSTDAPPGWSKWAIGGDPGQLDWLPSGGRSSKRCARIKGARLATFITKTPVKRGARYYASVWTKSTGSTTQIPKLGIKWQSNAGAWACGKANTEVSGAAGGGKWQELSCVFEAPEGADQLVIMPRVRDQQPDDVVLFDDVRVVALPDDL